MSTTLIDFMRTVYVFDGMPETALERIAGCGRERRFASRDILIDEGQLHQALFLIMQGTVDVVLPDPSNLTKPLKLTTCGAGSVLGEMSLVDPRPSQSVVWAKGPVRAFVIDYAALAAIMEDEPAIAATILRNQLRTLVGRLRADVSEFLSYRNAAA